MADDRSLPGWPKKKLVKAVRRHLSTYGIRPIRTKIWQATWVWAEAIARSYFQTHWPLPSEIGTQYILLLLSEMKKSRMLKLAYRASEVIPAEVAAMLPAQTDNPLAIESTPHRRKRQPRRLMSKESKTEPTTPLAEAAIER
jgi:hypothetical protein